jgi:hypothetical protein
MAKGSITSVSEVRSTVLIASIKRKERLQAASDYITFAVTKAFGLATLVVGILEKVDPNIFPNQILQPEKAIGVGLALLGGGRVVSLIAKIANALKS